MSWREADYLVLNINPAGMFGVSISKGLREMSVPKLRERIAGTPNREGRLTTRYSAQ